MTQSEIKRNILLQLDESLDYYKTLANRGDSCASMQIQRLRELRKSMRTMSMTDLIDAAKTRGFEV